MAETMLFKVTCRQNARTLGSGYVRVEFTVSKAGYDIIKRPDEHFTNIGYLTMPTEVWMMLKDTLERSPEYIDIIEIRD